ncbi:MAG: Ig-like domain-containing protein [Lachnospiraceae bacterium]|nr:Ig-like domain-containing protein [Lachnospiraceae bacterium]
MSKERTNMKNWFTRLCMCFAVALGILWASSNPAFAAAGDLVIGGTSNDSTQNCSGQGWSYVASTHTLTLNGVQFSYTGTDTGRPDGGIEYTGTEKLTITVNGTNSINGCWAGILCEYADLSINGSGSLAIEAQSDNENYYTDGIKTYNDLTMQAATITVNTDGFGVHGKNLVIESGDVTFTAGYDGIDCWSLTINGGSVKAVGKRCNGMQVAGQDAFVTINGGNVIAEGQSGGSGDMSSGIYCTGDVTISDKCTLIARAGTNVADQLEYVAIHGVVKNAIAGKGWMNYTGEGDSADIAVNTTGAELTYKRVAFPAGASSEVAVTGITLNKTTLSLTKGASETLTATVAPSDATDKTVTWTSDKPAVATVKDGKVTAVAAGKATITAKAGEKTAVCEVTVTEASSDIKTDPDPAKDPSKDTTTGTGDAQKPGTEDTAKKAANSLSVKAKNVTLKVKTVKKKNQKITAKKAYAIDKAVGKVSYKLVSVKKAKFKKNFSVNAKNGAITVKKGLKKGTYKVTVEITAAGSEQVLPASKKVTVTVKVK